ncbi:MAG: CBS domain-containing protein [Anaerolineae bacterium]
MNARDLMVANVMTVTADTSVSEIARLLTTYRLGSLPVVDANGHVLGIVSESDLFLKDKGIPYSAVKLPERFQQWVDAERLARIYESARTHTAADVMTTDVICVDVNEPIGRVAWLMMTWGIERAPVLQEERLVGMVSRADLIRWMAQAGEVVATAELSAPVALAAEAG